MMKPKRLSLIVTCVLLASIVVIKAACAGPGHSSSLGVNYFDLVRQFLGTSSGGNGTEPYRKVEVAMANKALHDAQINGAAFVRVSAPGFAPSTPGQQGDLSLWLSNPAEYWRRMDEVMAALDGHNLRGVFALLWNPLQFPALTGETVRDLITNPRSRSYALAARYAREFVGRYRGRHTVLFYETSNELNLGADLDLVARCRKSQPQSQCVTSGNYTTDQMIGFSTRMANAIREVDPKARIASGFALPRKAAEHIRARPEWITGVADFSPDTLDQFEKNLRDIHSMDDIIEVHIYPDPDGENRRFGASDPRSLVTLEATVTAAHRIGKPLFIGEFGDADRSDDSSFTAQVLSRIPQLKPDYSAPWTWEFYQTSLFRTHDSRPTLFSLQPGLTDQLIARFRRVAQQLGQWAPSPADLAHSKPHVVLTWPLDCTVLSTSQLVYATASDDASRLRSVDFLLDGHRFATVVNVPYQTRIGFSPQPGNHILAARAIGSNGLVAEYDTPVIAGHPAPGGTCIHAAPSASR